MRNNAQITPSSASLCSVVARYLGDREDRLEGEEYYSLIDEFMAAIKLRWPRALIQFEDFQSKHAVKLLARYFLMIPSTNILCTILVEVAKNGRGSCNNNVLCVRYKREYLMFNDDIQGTAATVLAGLYGAMKVNRILDILV